MNSLTVFSAHLSSQHTYVLLSTSQNILTASELTRYDFFFFFAANLLVYTKQTRLKLLSFYVCDVTSSHSCCAFFFHKCTKNRLVPYFSSLSLCCNLNTLIFCLSNVKFLDIHTIFTTVLLI